MPGGGGRTGQRNLATKKLPGSLSTKAYCGKDWAKSGQDGRAVRLIRDGFHSAASSFPASDSLR